MYKGIHDLHLKYKVCMYTMPMFYRSTSKSSAILAEFKERGAINSSCFFTVEKQIIARFKKFEQPRSTIQSMTQDASL